MGVAILVLGKSGSGKSTSLRNFKPGEIGIMNVSIRMFRYFFTRTIL